MVDVAIIPSFLNKIMLVLSQFIIVVHVKQMEHVKRDISEMKQFCKTVPFRWPFCIASRRIRQICRSVELFLSS